MIFLCIVAAAVLFRVRGGFMPTGSTALARAIYSAGMAALALWLTHNPWMLITAPLFYVGCVPGWYHSADMGLGEGTFWRDFLVNCARGFIFTLPPGLLLWYFGYSWHFAALGGLSAVDYSIGRTIPSRIKDLQRGMPLSEALYGATLGAALYLSLSGV